MLLLTLLLLLGVGEGLRGEGHPDPSPHFGGSLPPPPPPHDHSQGFGADHEAVLGPGGAKIFQELPPEESKRRLGLLVPALDGDGDGRVSRGELRAWVAGTRRRAREESVGEGLRRLDRDRDGGISWDEYRDGTYGTPEGPGLPPPHRQQAELERDKRRFQAADGDGDGVAQPPEFDAFLHPEDFQHMRPILLQETMEDMDRDGDGFIQEDEYIAELLGPSLGGGEEPPWVQREREQFRGGRDLDGDGRLEPREVGHWLQPPSHDWPDVEAQHLLHHSDRDGDGQLSREEILGNWEMFVGSQDSGYGHGLHDEL